MAVYKATYCYPFLNSFDPRVVPTQVEPHPAQYLKCKVDTSNKRITGYQIVIRDNENNIVFPVDKNQNNWKISPIQELEQDLDINGYINSGLNGTYLNIAFLQNLHALKYRSYNSVYYAGSYKADYIVSAEAGSDDPAGNIGNWALNNGKLIWNKSVEPETLNGEPFQYGDIVFVKTNSATPSKGGLWQVVSPTELRRYQDYGGIDITQEVLTTPVVATYRGGPGIMITRGNGVHGYYYYSTITKEYVFNDGSIISSPNPNFCLWLAGDLNVFSSSATLGPYTLKFDIDGGSYKWEITLYQGEGKIYVDTTEGASEVPPGVKLNPTSLYYIEYDDMSYDEYDMTLTSGQILGSTTTRLQLADKPTADLIGANGSVIGSLPGEGMSEPLVLLNKYAQLCDATGVPSFSNRVAVRNFDSSYGHVYLKEGAITKDILDQASKVAFYRYSNVLEDILEGDIVDVATPNTDTVILQNYNITIKSFGGGNTIDGVPITQGMKVLVKSCEDPRYNGVYIAETGTTESESGKKDVAWSRAGSFNNWGSFIGKILCVRQGAKNRGKNFQSQAKVGGTLLIPDGTYQTGGSYLYFNEEQPIVLFDTYPGGNIYQVDLATRDRFAALTTTCDGYKLRVGDRVLATTAGDTPPQSVYKIGTVTRVEPSLAWDIGTQIILDTDYVKVAQGVTYGNLVLKNMISVSDLSTAWILRNTTDCTFVSPFEGMDKGNALYFYNHDQVAYDTNPETKSSWMKVNAVYEKFWLIQHNTLKHALDSIDPYKYELRSYFRSSDENPFFTYEEPYLKLALNGSFHMRSDVNPDVEDYSVATTGRYVTLQGLYLQPQKSSWESYRWTLLNEKGEIVQDTGKRYDKELKTTFYGLNNDSGQNIYYAVLDVEDELNKSLSLTVRVTVNTEASLLGAPFNAEFDCETQSVVLYYQDTPFVRPSFDGTNYTEVYAADNSSALASKANILWDGSNTYVNEAMNITGKNGGTGAEWGTLDLPERRNNITRDQLTLFESTGRIVSQKLSTSVIEGIHYEHYFEENESEIPVNQKTLKLLSTAEDHDEFVFKTDFVLDQNYCGELLRLDVQGNANSTDNGLVFKLGIPDMKKGIVTSVTDTSNRISFDILSGGSSKFVTVQYVLNGDQPFTLFDQVEDDHRRYYLQMQDVDGSAYEYGHYEYLDETRHGKLKVYYLQKDGQLRPYGYRSYLSPNCLAPQDGADSGILNYWDESTSSSGNYTYQRSAMNNKYTGAYGDTTRALWPSESTESSLYWLENPEGYQDVGLPGENGQIDGALDRLPAGVLENYGFAPLRSYKRHPNMHTHYSLEIIVKDIQALYDSQEGSLTVEGDKDTEGYSITNISNNAEKILAIIKIKKLD